MTALPPRQLAAIGFRFVNDAGDRREVIREDVVQEEDGAFRGDSDSSSTRNAVDSDSGSTIESAKSGTLAVANGSGSHSPTWASRWTRADFSTSKQMRVVVVVSHAFGVVIACSSASALVQRMKASWTASSAGATLPNIR